MIPLLAAAAIPLLGKLFGGGGNKQHEHQQAQLDQQMQQLLGLQNRRLQQSEPLYQAIMQMAMGLMPRGSMQMPGMGGGMPQPGGMPQRQPAPMGQAAPRIPQPRY